MTSSGARSRLSPAAAPPPTAGRPTSRVRRWWRAAFSPFWVVPSVWCVLAVLAGLVLPEVDRGVESIPLLFRSGPEGARAVLSTIAGAMISVTGLVFSITIVVLQLASSQFTPRVLRTFLDDRITQNTLGVFASLPLRADGAACGDSAEDGYPAVPQLAVSLTYLYVLGAVGMFLAFIHHITSAISVGKVVGRTADDCRGLIADGDQEAVGLPHEDPVITHARHQHVVTSPRSGYVDLVDRHALLGLARARDVRIEVLHPLGTFVVEGSPLAVVHADAPVEGDDWPQAVGGCLDLARERSMQQDVSFGIRRLVDIAERALSPGINDPTTAVQVIDELHDVLRRMATRPDPYPVTADDDGVVRVLVSEWGFGDYLDLAVDEIAHWGSDSLQIGPRLDTMLSDLTAAAPHRREVVEAKQARQAGVAGRFS